MSFQIILVRIAGDFTQVIERHGAHTVRSGADPGSVGSPTFRESLVGLRALADDRASNTGNFINQSLQIFQVSLGILLNEPRLSGIRLSLKTRSAVCNPQQRDPQAGIAGGADNFFRQQIRIVVGRAIRRVVEIMKLADGSDPAQRHFQKGQARSVVDIFRGQARRG